MQFDETLRKRIKTRLKGILPNTVRFLVQRLGRVRRKTAGCNLRYDFAEIRQARLEDIDPIAPHNGGHGSLCHVKDQQLFVVVGVDAHCQAVVELDVVSSTESHGEKGRLHRMVLEVLAHDVLRDDGDARRWIGCHCHGDAFDNHRQCR